jgi:hypothetical protein
MEKTINIGIVCDGRTDFPIFSKIVQCILESSADGVHFNSIELSRHKVSDPVAQYWRVANKKQEYYLPSMPALKLQQDVLDTLNSAFYDFENEVGLLSNYDILLVVTDAEQSLSKPDDYFKTYAFSISKIFTGAIEQFYDSKAKEYYSRHNLPLILSLVTFPSTEIFVAIAKNLRIRDCYHKKPKELKRLLYGTEDLYNLPEEVLKEKALKYITPESIDTIFQNIPESRVFIQSLSIHAVTMFNEQTNFI